MYFEALQTELEARQREMQIKKMKSRIYMFIAKLCLTKMLRRTGIIINLHKVIVLWELPLTLLHLKKGESEN